MANPLDASSKLAIREEVEKYLGRIAAFFGAGNVLVVLGAIWLLWQSVTGQVEVHSEQIARQMRDDFNARLAITTSQLNAAINDANRLIGKLEVSAENLDEVEVRITDLREKIIFLEDEKIVSFGASFLQDLYALEERETDLTDLVATISTLSVRLDSIEKSTGIIESGIVHVPHTRRPTGDSWEEIYREQISFENDFQTAPQLFLSVNGIESYKRTPNVTYRVSAENLNETGFQLVVSSAYDSSFSNAAISWLAIDAAFHGL